MSTNPAVGSIATSLRKTLINDNLLIELKTPENQKYTATLLHLQDAKGLSEWFDNLQELNQHLNNVNNYNYQKNAEECKFNVLGKHPTKQNAVISIATIRLLKVQNQHQLKSGFDSLQQVISVCNKKQEISGIELKEILGFLIKNILKKQGNLQQQQKKQKSNHKKQQSSSDQKWISKLQFTQLKQEITSSVLQIQNQLKQLKNQIKILPNMKSYMSENSQQIKQIITSQISKKQEQISRSSLRLSIISQQAKEKDQIFQHMMKKISKNSEAVQLRLDKIQDRLQVLQNKFDGSHVQTISRAESFVDPDCYGYKNLIIQLDKIIKIRGQELDVFSRQKIEGKYSFSLQITEITGWICIGVASNQYKNVESFSNQPNCIVYYNDGNFYNGVSTRGKIVKGFQKWDKVVTNVDRSMGKIQWIVNGQLRISYNYQRLKTNAIQWVPYIWMLKNGSSVKVLK